MAQGQSLAVRHQEAINVDEINEPIKMKDRRGCIYFQSRECYF